MTFDQINARAYDEARRHFKAMVLDGISIEAAMLKRADVYEAMRRSRCGHCHIEKHISEFHDASIERPQSWCKQCFNDSRQPTTANREKRDAWKGKPLEFA